MPGKDLNIGMVGYGFMGRCHSNAFRTAPNFFDLPRRPVLEGRLRARPGEDPGLRRHLGLRERRDRLAKDDRAPRYRPRRHLRAERPAPGDRRRRGRGRQDGHHREADRPHHGGGRGDGRRGREGRGAQPRLLQLPPHPGGELHQADRRQRQARPHLSLPGDVPAGLDDLARRAAGRTGYLAARPRGRGLRRNRRPARPLHRYRDVDQRADRQPHRHDRDFRQAAQARRDRPGPAGRHRRRRRGPRPLRQRLDGHLRVRRATPAATRRSTPSRSTASTAPSPGTCTTSTGSPGSTTASRAHSAAGARSSSPTASTPTSAAGGCPA